MANIVQDPPTYAKVILKTTHGDLDIELWTKESPLACRNFIQLCLEQYYDNCIFHRLIPGFMIQTGDPTGTGEGGDSIYGGCFKDEFNQRLQFSHRGRVAMANNEAPNTNTSQFFITFDSCTWLNKKHTIFGKIVGETICGFSLQKLNFGRNLTDILYLDQSKGLDIPAPLIFYFSRFSTNPPMKYNFQNETHIYNLLNMQGLDTDANDRPVNPPKILTTLVLINPFEDIVVRNVSKKIEEPEKKEEKIQEKKKLKVKDKVQAKNRNLLSFDDEEEGVQGQKKGIKSSHDVVESKRLSKKPVVDLKALENPEKNENNNKNKINSPKPKKQVKTEEIPKNLKNYKTRLNKKTGKLELYWPEKDENDSQDGSDYESGSSTPDEEYLNEEQKRIRQQQKQEYENLKIDFLKFKNDKLGTNNPEERARILNEKKLLSNLEKRKLKYMNQGEVQKEKQKLDKLDQFRKQLNSGQGGYSWTQHNLKFHIDSQRAYQTQQVKEKVKQYNREHDDFSIIDSRNEQEKKELQDREQIKLQDILTVDDLIKITNKGIEEDKEHAILDEVD